jgi:hypothetical protein
MADLRNIRNSGIIVGGDVTRSTLSVGDTGSAGGDDEALVLRQVDTLLNDLLAGVGQLPAERAGVVASDTVRLKEEIARPDGDRDPGRMRALLSSLAAGVAVVAPLAEIVTDITELISRIAH